MKKAKIMLSAMVVITLLSGALVFKATNFYLGIYYYSFTTGAPCLNIKTGVVVVAPKAGQVIYYAIDYAQALIGNCATGSFTVAPQ